MQELAFTSALSLHVPVKEKSTHSKIWYIPANQATILWHSLALIALNLLNIMVVTAYLTMTQGPAPSTSGAALQRVHTTPIRAKPLFTLVTIPLLFFPSRWLDPVFFVVWDSWWHYFKYFSYLSHAGSAGKAGVSTRENQLNGRETEVWPFFLRFIHSFDYITSLT